MKKNIYLTIVWLLAFTIMLTGCLYNNVYEKSPEEIAAMNNILVTSEKPRLSPSEKYILEINYVEIEDVKSFHFRIVDAEDRSEIYISDDYYRIRDTYYLLWGEKDLVWVYSGDLGTFYWEKINENTWEKKSYSENKKHISVPQTLLDLRPKYYGQIESSNLFE